MQLDFTAHIRNPKHNGLPEGLEPRRMKIYLELLYNNVENFLSTTFPVARSTFTAAAWELLVRDYLHRHKASSPYFLEIPQEFLEFLANTRAESHPQDPPWLLELCHYEWVELALDVADLEMPWDRVDPDADFWRSPWVVSPLIWSLGYRYPVHTIGPNNSGDVAEQATWLIVFRDSDYKVRFIESDAPTSRFLELLGGSESGASDAADGSDPVDAGSAPVLRAVVDQMIQEMPQLSSADVERKMLATLRTLRGADIVLGPARQSGGATDSD